ncbi:MAG: hypothetical protein PWP44_406, partial [Thermacetogenium sp.]|nr:hypothetical protein [Thermacetogenium sp.]
DKELVYIYEDYIREREAGQAAKQ